MRLIDPEFAWKEGYGIFYDSDIALKSDTIILVNPETNILLTADPAAISQITTRRADFQKPIAIYEGIDIYGKNVVTTEGTVWRRHRKNTIPPFGEKNNRVVWKESLFQATQMLQHWRNTSTENGQIQPNSAKGWGAQVSSLSHDAMRLSLYVISRAGFDIRCEWPGQSTSAQEGVRSANEIPEGHQMSYMDSLETLLLSLITLLIAPIWLLGGNSASQSSYLAILLTKNRIASV
jgi:hypothetical protein